MACRPYNTGRCLQLRLFNCPNFGVHFNPVSNFSDSIGEIGGKKSDAVGQIRHSCPKEEHEGLAPVSRRCMKYDG